ncbi:hypothetical protein [Sphingomonas sp. J344]|uniref:hypothetical protein n=1 Tax=Sphingomonas sp. J344 TaxID=2898434 RepID=UPI0027E3A497|nr:hypothetical protein [Sphingomonas sp. J344]
MMPRPLFRAAITIALATPMLAAPASAQISVFDPTNYAQNLLTAARALSQINNQIQSLQNEATMLANMAKNMKPGEFPQFEALKARLAQIDTLMDRAQGISFRVDQLDAQFERLFPRVGVDALDTDARGRARAPGSIPRCRPINRRCASRHRSSRMSAPTWAPSPRSASAARTRAARSRSARRATSCLPCSPSSSCSFRA